MITLKNNTLEVSVKEIGAELCSIKSLKTNIEYIWNADPEVWASHAPNLFPIIGCLKDNGFIYQGKEYKCPKHGFIRNNKEITCIDKTENSLTFGLKYSKESLKIYPFKFEFQIKFTLDSNKITVLHHIINHGTDDMLFSLGAHPGFTCPIHKGENYKDYYLEFEKEETSKSWEIEKDGLIGSNTKSVFDEPKIIHLHANLFDDDALVFKDLHSRRVSLKSKKSKQVLVMDFKGFPYLGIWAKPNATYVCIEPWMGIADSADTDRNFENKEGLIRLKSKNNFKATYSISIIENNN